ncbi:Flagellar M-ring protein FliF [hydrothermal vent metagenome]|uniref:Flagellar M-ring protein FliF n=1 Tax=hydrothermal vent metagenome TaxID=652676 RepID=A0A3B0XBS0_9ZZZZ
MALVTADNLIVGSRGFNALPVFRQLGLMIGLALSVALGVTVAMWSQTPNYSMLYGNLSAKDLSQVTKSLDSAGIDYKFEGSGGLLVPSDKINSARMKLAATSLSPGGIAGYELLDKNQGLGSSSFLLKARYQRAIEGELAQSISELNFVESARVHLAIPKQSAFMRKISKPAASVVLNIAPGWVVDDAQTASIVNIVASSVPGLNAEQVTVVDSKGRLLSSKGNRSDALLSSTQFEYTRKLEERYVRRIIDIVSPMSGSEGVRAQVVADIDFTSQEETRESYQPDQKIVRSEQLFKQSNSQSGASGIPGALSNQPPAGGSLSASDNAPDAAAQNVEKQNTENTAGNNSSRTVRNYEIDRTISHTRQSPITLKRLSVAVVVDYRTVAGKKGKVKREPLTEEEMQRLTSLITEAVGLKEARGDTIKIVNTPFQLPEKVEPLPELPIWEQPWALTLAKQLLGALVVLLIAFGILRPMLSNLATQGKNIEANYAALPQSSHSGNINAGEDQLTLSNQQPPNSQQLLDAANTMVKEDPKRVAQVLNTWVEADE